MNALNAAIMRKRMKQMGMGGGPKVRNSRMPKGHAKSNVRPTQPKPQVASRRSKTNRRSYGS